MSSVATSVHCRHCERDVPVLLGDPRCPYCQHPVAVPVTRKGQPLPWAKKVLTAVLAVAVVGLDLYRTESLEAAILGALVVVAVFFSGAALSRGWAADAPPPYAAHTDWLEEASASHRRGTGIATLAVRYDVDPDWLAAELTKPRPAGGAR